MEPSDARNAALAVLAIVALALIAATLPGTVTTGGMGGEGGLAGTGDDGLLPEPPTPSPAPDPIRIPFLAELIAVIAALVAIVALLSLLVHWRVAIVLTLVMTIVLGILWAITRLLADRAGSFSMPPIFAGNGSAFGRPGSPDAIVPSTPRSLLLVVVTIVVVVAIAMLLIDRRADVGDDGPVSGEADAATAVGRAAGRAADRIEDDRDVQNQVYRAWLEMTELLDVPSRRAATPGEFAAAAVDAGLSADDVTSLTTLFEDVRYGGREASAADERTAVRTFRRIEAEYAGEAG